MKREIWIIDDNMTVRLATQLAISKAFPNSTLVLFEDAYYAFENLDKVNDDREIIMVLDVEMPLMNGFEFCGRFKYVHFNPKVNVVVHTSLNCKEIAAEMDCRYDFDVVEKLNFKKLIDSIQKFCGGST